MNDRISDTIVAVSSSAGVAERAIVRMSGPEAVAAASQIFQVHEGPLLDELPGWSCVRGRLELSDFAAPIPTLCCLMRKPRSYTREDVVEFHVVGSPAIVAEVLSELQARGIRPARPGEFTERAYLSGRIDLAQAEAVLKLVHAAGDAERKLALGELSGELSRSLGELTERLTELLTRMEVTLDFSEDELPTVESEVLDAELAAASRTARELIRDGKADTVYTESPRISIVGRANVGKSSLFNRLLGRDEAIVTDIRGTTRDVLEAELELEGVKCTLTDTAGEKPAEADLDELALERARAERELAEVLLVVVDASVPLTAIDAELVDKLAGTSGIAVLNKTDLPLNTETDSFARSRCPVAAVSCVTGGGIELLREELVRMVTLGGLERPGLRFALNVRQVDSLRAAGEALTRATGAVREDAGLEFAAAELRAAVNHLRDMTHPLDEEEILDRIFSRFCIGK